MNSLASNFALKLAGEAPDGVGPIIGYTKVYVGKLYDEYVTVEDYLDGKFDKHRKIPTISPSTYKPPKPATQKTLR